MEITHLVVNGCSGTYGSGLTDPPSQAWPALLAKELGLPIVNLAQGGSGNDGIHRRTYEYIYENIPTGSKPLVVIAWSQPWRREAWYEERDGELKQDYYIVPRIPESTGGVSPELDLYQRTVIPHWNAEDFVRRTLLNKVSLQNLFMVYNIPYIMTDFHLDLTYPDYRKALTTSKCKSLYPVAYNKFHIDPFLPKIDGYKPLPCGHPGPDAHEILAKYTLSEINKLHPNLTIIDGEYLPIYKFIFRKKGDASHWKPIVKRNRFS